MKLGFVDQSRDALDAKKNVWEEISGGLDIIVVGNREIPSRAYVSSFNFKGGDQQKKVGQLSGGERNRVHLAKTLLTGANVLLLDEPTNDLDVETLQSLEAALEDFAGCAVVISHDRWFLNRLATHILAFEGDSHVEWFEGDFDSYEEDKMRRLGVTRDRAEPDQVSEVWTVKQSAQWIALAREASLAAESVAAGLTALRKAQIGNTGTYPLAFFQLTIGIEQVLKLILVIDFMLDNAGLAA